MNQVTRLSTRARVRSLGLLAAGMLAPFSAFTGRAAAQADTVEPADLQAPLTLVVAGLDSREVDQPENTDVFMLARVDVPNRLVRAISIPRDLYLEIPTYGYDKITRAYDFGSKSNNRSFKAGSALARDTVLANFGIATDGSVMTTFKGFEQIVDAMGGVKVVNPYDLYDSEYPTYDYGYKEIFYPAGEIRLSGAEALEFCRTRHQDGDDGRVMRQQLVIRALLERARDPELAPDLPRIMAENRSAIRTDLGASKQLALALAAPDFTNDGVEFGTLAGLVYPDTAPGGMWIYSGDWSQIPGYVEAFLSGQI